MWNKRSERRNIDERIMQRKVFFCLWELPRSHFTIIYQTIAIGFALKWLSIYKEEYSFVIMTWSLQRSSVARLVRFHKKTASLLQAMQKMKCHYIWLSIALMTLN